MSRLESVFIGTENAAYIARWNGIVVLQEKEMTEIILIGLGILLLVMGRRLFWLFVGAVGFAAGYLLATNYLAMESDITRLIIALIAGVVGAILAQFVQRFAVAIAGFIAGGYLLTTFLEMIGYQTGLNSYLVFLIGGIVGVLLVVLVFDWALILLSSMVGASMLVNAFGIDSGSSGFLNLPDLSGGTATIILIVLVIIGIAIQSRRL